MAKATIRKGWSKTNKKALRQRGRHSGQSGAAGECKGALIRCVAEGQRVVVPAWQMYSPSHVMAVTGMMETCGTHDKLGVAIDHSKAPVTISRTRRPCAARSRPPIHRPAP